MQIPFMSSRRTQTTPRRRYRLSLDTLEGLEQRCLLSITEFSLPLNEGTAPMEIASGPDGNLWFGFEYNGGYIGTINPTSYATTEFPVNGFVNGVAAGSDGNIWFTGEYNGQVIGVISPTTHSWTEFTLNSDANGIQTPGITAGPDGNLWFTDDYANAIGTINPTTHAITEFTLPTSNATPTGITSGPDGNLWFMESGAGQVGMIDPTTHAITGFALSTAAPWPYFEGITTGPDGNLWFTDLGAHKIGEINPTTQAIAEFPVPTASANLFSITAGANGNLWFTEANVGQLGEINPTTHAVTEFGIPYAGAYPFGIAAGPDGNVWFTDANNDGPNNAVGVATLNTDYLVVTQQPPGTVTAGSGFGFTVTAEDSSGNPITSFNGTVTVALGNNPGGATLGGTLSATASNGSATFAGLTIDKAASGYTLYASGGGYGLGITSPISVTPAAATQLVISRQPPATVKPNSGFGFQASIEDRYGNVVTTATNTVKVAFAKNPTGATLGGTLSVTASQGVATFSGLTINKTGSGYTLQVSSSGLSSAVTNAINVTHSGNSPSPLSALAVVSAPDSALAPLAFDSPDFWDALHPLTKHRGAH